jgi:hypothetical protein
MGGSLGSAVVCRVSKRMDPEIYPRDITDFLKADQIEMLEKERSWKEEEFDFVLQFLRTVLLKRKLIRSPQRLGLTISQMAHPSSTQLPRSLAHYKA